MKKNILSFIVGLSFIILVQSPVLAASKPCPSFKWRPGTITTAVTDTVPANNKTQEEKDPKKDEVIKAVPKSRKQDKPVAVSTVPIKPVVVKPTIIVKPVIKIH
jgi:hypothetical protein